MTPALPLQVDEIPGERMRAYVHSETNPRVVYLCDLLARGGLGECSCPIYKKKWTKVIREGRLSLEEAVEWHPDKHLRAFRRKIHVRMWERLAKEEGDK